MPLTSINLFVWREIHHGKREYQVWEREVTGGDLGEKESPRERRLLRLDVGERESRETFSFYKPMVTHVTL
jgi:hypothetical protein